MTPGAGHLDVPHPPPGAAQPSQHPLLATVLAAVATGVALSLSPLAEPLGFTRAPAALLATLTAMVVAYLVVVEVGKRLALGGAPPPLVRAPRRDRERLDRSRRVHRRAARYSVLHRRRA